MELRNTWSWIRKFFAIAFITVFLLWIVLKENSCLFGRLTRKITLHRIRLVSASDKLLEKISEHVKVEEIPLDDFAHLNLKVTKVQVIPLLTNNESFKVISNPLSSLIYN